MVAVMVAATGESNRFQKGHAPWRQTDRVPVRTEG
jgi:hypothetical protein